MPKYTVEDTQTGQQITFEWYGKGDPTDADMEEIFAEARGQEGPQGVSVPAELDPSTARMVERATGVRPKEVLFPPGPAERPGRFQEGLSLMGKTISRFPESLVDVGKGAVAGVKQAVTSPVETTGALLDLAIGSVGRAMLGDVPGLKGGAARQQALARGVQEGIKKLGTREGIREQVTEHPAETMLYLSPALRGLGTAARTAGLARTGQALTTAGATIDPFTLTAKGIAATGRAGRAAIRHGTGVLTGKGAPAVEMAFTKGKPFQRQMRAKTSGEEIVRGVKDSLEITRNERSATYIRELRQLEKSTQNIDITPIRNKLTELLYGYGVRVGGKGKLDFSRSTITPGSKEAKDIETITKTIRDWGTKKADTTPIMLDTLKRRLDHFYSDSSQARSMVTQLRGTTKDLIVKNVPQYARMTAEYEKSSTFIKNVEQALSSGKKANIDTTLKKLTSAIKEDSAYRRSLIKDLNIKSGYDIEAEIAGYLMRDPLPSGLFGRQVEAGLIFGLVAGWSPTLAAAMLAGSPRVVGEFMNVMGKAVRASERTNKILRRVGITHPALRQAAVPVGAVAEQQQQAQQLPLTSGEPKLRDFLSPHGIRR